MTQVPSLRNVVRRARSVSLSQVTIVIVVAGLLMFRIATRLQPGYDPAQDSLSSLASNGAAGPWIGMLAIATSGLVALIAMISLRRLTPPGALALGVAGVALFLVAGTRIDCPGGAAGCLMGPTTSYLTATSHTMGLILFEVMFIGAIASAAICLWRGGWRRMAMVAIIGIILSLFFFAVAPTGIGLRQRAWLLVNTVLMAGCVVIPARFDRRESRSARAHAGGSFPHTLRPEARV